MLAALIKIVALLAGGTLVATELPPLLEGLSAGGQVVTTANDMDLVKTVLITYQLDNGHYPTAAALADVIRKGIGGRQDPEKDRWGTPFQIGGVPATPFVLSCGPDKECGNEDDLKLWVAGIPEGEKQLDFSDLVQKNLLDRLVGRLMPTLKETEPQVAPPPPPPPPPPAPIVAAEPEQQPDNRRHHRRKHVKETADAPDAAAEVAPAGDDEEAPRKHHKRRRKHATVDN
jgi:hypothetical protein